MKNLIILILTATCLLMNTLLHAQCYDLSTGADTMGFENTDTNEFYTKWEINDVNSNDTSWERSSYISHNGDFSIVIKQYNDDWLFSRCYELDSNEHYDLSFWYYMDNPFIENQGFYLVLSTTTDSTGIVDTLVYHNQEYYNSSFTKISKIFSPQSNNNYYIGWYAFGPSHYLVTSYFFDDIVVSEYQCDTDQVDLGNDTTICAGDSILLDAGSGFENYSWNTGADNQTIKVDSGTYYVEVTAEYGCKSYDTVVVTVITIPDDTLIYDGNTTFCIGDSLVLEIQLENANCEDYDITWTPGNSTDSIITIKYIGNYFCQIADTQFGCTITSDTIDVEVRYPYNEQEICLVTVDENGNNEIVWEKEDNNYIKSFKIYRETFYVDSFELIETLPYDSLSTYVDTDSEPGKKPYVYGISVVDSCDNESSLSDYHVTIHLTISQGIGDKINLNWTDYEGFEYYTFRIYRDTNSSSQTLFDSVQAYINSYTDENPPEGNVYYQVEVVKDEACNPTRAGYSSSLSNKVDKLSSGIMDEELKGIEIYPNPANDKLTIFNPYKSLEIQVVDIRGEIIKTLNVQKGTHKVNIENISKGIYFIKFINNKISANYKLIKN
ncbi:MAG: T9SS type A sorting domain-containing protein [Bacteroidota bacterium]|nr:T9SS type A sorting domain-containing protein [Bacteroidota bacterium]